MRFVRIPLFLLAMCPLGLSPRVSAQPPPGPGGESHVKFSVLANKDGLIPGEIIELAIIAKIDKDWHIYWQSPGPAAGLPTVIKWNLPQGFGSNATLFPVPKIVKDPELKMDSFFLEGEVIFVTPVRVPASAKIGTMVNLSAEVSYLACKKQCIPGSGKAAITLSVQSSGDTKPANDELFKKARRRFPIQPEKAEHIKLAVKLDQKTVKPGQEINAILQVTIDSGHHMQAHDPLQPELIPAYVLTEPLAGFEIGDPVYPPGKDRKVGDDDTFREYSGHLEFKIPLTADKDAGIDPRWLRGVLQYQLCNDSGTCYPPQYVSWILPIQMEGGPTPPATPRWMMSSVANASVSPAPQAPAPGAGHGMADASLRSPNWLARAQDYLLSFGYFGVLVAAFLGGLIMNLMPCVLPVISLKVLSFVRQAQEDRTRIFVLGMSYCCGIMVFFSIIAGLFLWNGTGWGQLFQRPHVVLGLAAVVTAFALSLFGVFAVFTPKVINVLAEKAEGEGLISAFTTGVLATFLGTACTAPFLSAAVGAASRFAGPQGAGIFLAVGLGMAFPFFFLSAKPGWLKFIPRPGPWMGTFEATMGFLLLGTVVWLLNPLRNQIGDYGLLLSLIFLLGVAMAAWVKGKIQFGDSFGRKTRLMVVASAILAIGWVLPFRIMSTIPELAAKQNEREDQIALAKLVANSGLKEKLMLKPPEWVEGKIEIPWQRYERGLAMQAVKEGYTIFIDYTADWCANCKTMLKTAIETPQVIAVMKELNVIPLTADYTSESPKIKEDLMRFKRAGVPVFAVYAPGNPDDPQLLPELITPRDVVDALKRAGPSKPLTAPITGSAQLPAAP